MLVLGRRVGQKVILTISKEALAKAVFSDNLRIEVILCKRDTNGTDRIGFLAPPFVNIVRSELLPQPETK